jgi:hypothetical protein
MHLKLQVLSANVTNTNGLRLAKIAKAVCLQGEPLHNEAFKSAPGKLVTNVMQMAVIRQIGTRSMHPSPFLSTLPTS